MVHDGEKQESHEQNAQAGINLLPGSILRLVINFLLLTTTDDS